MMNGFINLLKPPGMTSHDAVNYIRRQMNIKKVGHTGTLDPGVSGVLPLCLGKATRLSEYIVGMPKKYRAEITLGIATDTHDAFGTVTDVYDCKKLVPGDFIKTAAWFQGEMEQIPPMVSAVRIKGKRLYQLARQGIEIERKARSITVYKIDIFQINWKMPYPKVLLDITCSKGTYIRTLCHDIGRKMGIGAHMSFLIRTVSGPFLIEKSLTLEEIDSFIKKNDQSFVQPLQMGIVFLPVIRIEKKQLHAILHGNTISLTDDCFIQKGLYRIEGADNRLLAVGQVFRDGKNVMCKPIKVLGEE